MRGHGFQWISHKINIRHPGQSKTAPKILIFFNCHGCPLFILCESHFYLCPHIFWVYHFSLSKCVLKFFIGQLSKILAVKTVLTNIGTSFGHSDCTNFVWNTMEITFWSNAHGSGHRQSCFFANLNSPFHFFNMFIILEKHTKNEIRN